MLKLHLPHMERRDYGRSLVERVKKHQHAHDMLMRTREKNKDEAEPILCTIVTTECVTYLKGWGKKKKKVIKSRR